MASSARPATGFTPRLSEDAALRDVAQRARSLADSSSVPEEEARGARRRIVVAAMAAALASVTLVGIAVAQDEPDEGEVAATHGLNAHPFREGDVFVATAEGLTQNGQVIDDPDCASADAAKITLFQELGDHFYCITAPTEIDAWIIGQRLQGHEPTAEEIDAQTARLEE